MTVYSKEQALTQFDFVETGLADVSRKAGNLHAIIDQYGTADSDLSHRHIKDIICALGNANGLLYRIRYDWEQHLTANPEWDDNRYLHPAVQKFFAKQNGDDDTVQ